MSLERYARHALIDWFDQDLIQGIHAIVVGAGAIGNEVLKNLTLLGVGRIDVFDLDRVEASNLTRSVLFRESDIGLEKAACAAARARDLDPAVDVRPHHGDFWQTLSFATLRSAAVVFGCLDNFESRVRLNRLCALLGVPLVNTGIDSRFAVAEIFPFGAAVSSGCYECGLPPSVYAAMGTRYSCGGLRRVALAERKVPTTILTASATASLAVSAFLRSVLQGEGVGEATRVYHDSFTGLSTRVTIPRLAGCPGCGDLVDGRIVIEGDRSKPQVILPADRLPADGSVLFSDRVVTRIRCRRCQPGDDGTIVFRAAGEFNDSLVVCPECRAPSRAVEIQDRIELCTLRRVFGGRPWPGKFVIYTEGDLQIVVELTGGSDV
jgi:molybdopterin-synthase adenylyltransferase